MVQVIEGLAGDWRRLDERIECLSVEIEALARQEGPCDGDHEIVGALVAWPPNV
jgi:hypothetical protein